MSKVLLTSGVTYNATNNVTILGNAGFETVKVQDGAVVTLDGNIERVEFARPSSDYTYQATPTGINLFLSGSRVASVVHGEKLAFTNGSALVAATFTPQGLGFTLGGTFVPSNNAGAVSFTPNNSAGEASTLTAAVVVTPTFSVVATGNAKEATNATFTVNLSAAQSTATAVNLVLTPVGGASALDFDFSHLNTPAGFTLSNNVLTFPSGTTTATVNIPIISDTISPETGEGLRLELTSVVGSTARASTTASLATVNVIDVPVIYEDQSPIIYLTSNVQQLDSITTLLEYTPAVTNNVNYANYDALKWRTRASSPELAIDLSQTNNFNNQVVLQGQLESNSTSQIWYKIHLTQTSALQVQDLSSDSAIVGVALFDANKSGLTYSKSIYDSTNQLDKYANVTAGDYYVRIDKGDAASNNAKINQAIDFNVLINTQPSDDFIVPVLNLNDNKTMIHVDLSPTKTEVFYKFSLSSNSQITLNTTQFASEFSIDIVQLTANGYSVMSSNVYNLTPGTFYLRVKSINPLTESKSLAIPAVLSTSINTTFNNNPPNFLKVDLTNAKSAITNDLTGNLVITYSFDLKQITGTDDAQPNATIFTDIQKQATRLALQDYANIAKLTFREIAVDSNENARIVFTNVSDLGTSAGVTYNHSTNSKDLFKATIQIDSSKDSNKIVNVGSTGYSTLLHEIGHALGLKHPSSYGSGGASSESPFLVTAKDNMQYSIMSYNMHPYKDSSNNFLYNYEGATSSKTPLLYDVAAIQLLYGANTLYRNEDTVYRWDTNTDPYMTIWDSGGINTIDVSNQAQKQVIDLRAGHFSSIGAMSFKYNDGTIQLNNPKDNVSIAYGVVIQNAIASPQDDIIIGNSVSNMLTGGEGKDNFVFSSPLNGFNVDTITDFSANNDFITLDRSIFAHLNLSNKLSDNELLVSNSATYAENSLQRIIFNSLTHNLYYDYDGTSEHSVLFANIPNVATLNAGQIFIQG